MSRRLIIFEGMDAVGKDTQLKAIVNHYPHRTFHTLHYHAVKNRDWIQARVLAEKTYRQMFDICRIMSECDIILNRSHYGEYVYGAMYRGYTDPEYVFNLERQMHIFETIQDAALIVLVNSDTDALIYREDGDSLSQGQRALIDTEFRRFHDVFLKSAVPRRLLLDVNGMSIAAVTAKITSWLDEVYPNDATTANDD